MKKVSFIIVYLIFVLLFISYLCLPISSAGIKLLCILAIAMFLYTANFILAKKHPNYSAEIMKWAFLSLFILYIYFLITLVLFDGYFGRKGFSDLSYYDITQIKEHAQNNLNHIPFKTIFHFFSDETGNRAFVVNIIGNLAAFAPFGFFIPLLFRKVNNSLKLVLSVSLIVIVVELLQLILLTGSCDIDDVILNTLGAYIVYVILKIPFIEKAVNKFTFCNS